MAVRPPPPPGSTPDLGYLYILTNASMPELLKVGRTARDPHERARELSTTGVPTPFEVAWVSRALVNVSEAEAAAHKTADLKSVVQGLDMLYGEFKRFLREEGLEEVPSDGTFDPELHEAVESEEDEGPDGRILGVVQKGYRFQGTVLRPARVRVSRRKKEKDSGADASD